MKINNRILIIISLVFIIVLAVGILLNLKKKPVQISQNSTFPKIVNPQGDTIIDKSDLYQITFLPHTNEYVITVYKTPLETYRQEVETAFLQKLNITESAACQLKVSIGIPYFVDPNTSSQTYPLSFCTGPTSVIPSINPASNPLQVSQVYPIQGQVAIGNTEAAIFITFNQPVDLKTVAITVVPQITLTPSIHIVKKEQLTLSPTTNWSPNTTYSITLKAGLTSTDGKSQLKENATFIYNVTPFVQPNYNEGGI